MNKPIETKATEQITTKSTKGVDNPLDSLYDLKVDETAGYTDTGKFDIPEELKDPRFAYAFPLVSQVNEKISKGWHVYQTVMSKDEGRTGSSIEFFGTLDTDLKEVGHILMIKRADLYKKDLEHIQTQTDRQEEGIIKSINDIKGIEGEFKQENKTKIKL